MRAVNITIAAIKTIVWTTHAHAKFIFKLNLMSNIPYVVFACLYWYFTLCLSN